MSLIIISTLVAAFSLGIFRILEKVVGTSIHPMLGAIFIYAGALAFLILVFIIRPVEIVIDFAFKKGVLIAVLAGVFIAVFDILALSVFRKGGDISFFTPIVNGGSILIVALIAALFLRESISLTQIIAMLAIIGGIFFLTK